jgi:hypothetical protein
LHCRNYGSEVRDETWELRFLGAVEGIEGGLLVVDFAALGGGYRQISSGGGTEFC